MDNIKVGFVCSVLCGLSAAGLSVVFGALAIEIGPTILFFIAWEFVFTLGIGVNLVSAALLDSDKVDIVCWMC